MLTHPNSCLQEEVTASCGCKNGAKSQQLDSHVIVAVTKDQNKHVTVEDDSVLSGRTYYSVKGRVRARAKKFLDDLVPKFWDCGNILMGKDEHAFKLNEAGNVYISGTASCGNYVCCPVCAAKIAQERCKELTLLNQHATDLKYSIGMLTLTIPHHRKDNLSDLMSEFKAARRKMFASRAYKNLRGKGKLLGFMSTLEVTHGENGFHPHLHMLLYGDCSDFALGEIADEMKDLWCVYQGKAFNKKVEKCFQHFRIADPETGSEYITKSGWKASQEISDVNLSKKGAKWGHRSMFQVLCDATLGRKINQIKHDIAVFREYVSVFRHTTQLQPSFVTENGERSSIRKFILKRWEAHFGKVSPLRKEKTDEELASKVVEKEHICSVVHAVSYIVNEVSRNDDDTLKEKLFNAAGSGIDSIVDEFRSYGIPVESVGDCIVPSCESWVYPAYIPDRVIVAYDFFRVAYQGDILQVDPFKEKLLYLHMKNFLCYLDSGSTDSFFDEAFFYRYLGDLLGSRWYSGSLESGESISRCVQLSLFEKIHGKFKTESVD